MTMTPAAPPHKWDSRRTAKAERLNAGSLYSDGKVIDSNQPIVAKMTQLPAILRKTLTWDQGREMTSHVHPVLQPPVESGR